MRKFLALMLAATLASPAMADPDIQLVASDGQAIIEKRPTFKERHPKMYKAYLRGRKVCHTVQPFLDAAGSTAQIILLFVE